MPLWHVNHKVVLGSEPSLTKLEQANVEGTKPGHLLGHHAQGTAAPCVSGSLQVKEHIWETSAKGHDFFKHLPFRNEHLRGCENLGPSR